VKQNRHGIGSSKYLTNQTALRARFQAQKAAVAAYHGSTGPQQARVQASADTIVTYDGAPKHFTAPVRTPHEYDTHVWNQNFMFCSVAAVEAAVADIRA
jgi:hypothetical protein